MTLEEKMKAVVAATVARKAAEAAEAAATANRKAAEATESASVKALVIVSSPGDDVLVEGEAAHDPVGGYTYGVGGGNIYRFVNRTMSPATS